MTLSIVLLAIISLCIIIVVAYLIHMICDLRNTFWMNDYIYKVSKQTVDGKKAYAILYKRYGSMEWMIFFISKSSPYYYTRRDAYDALKNYLNL